MKRPVSITDNLTEAEVASLRTFVKPWNRLIFTLAVLWIVTAALGAYWAFVHPSEAAVGYAKVAFSNFSSSSARALVFVGFLGSLVWSLRSTYVWIRVRLGLERDLRRKKCDLMMMSVTRVGKAGRGEATVPGVVRVPGTVDLSCCYTGERVLCCVAKHSRVLVAIRNQ
jgi:hypothetical protein